MKKRAGAVILAGSLLFAVFLLKCGFTGVDITQGSGSMAENMAGLPSWGKSRIEEVFGRLNRTGGQAGEQVPGGLEPVESISTDRYAYATLDDVTKRVYDEILNAILAHEEKIRVDTLDILVLDAAYKAVSADYGGLFWVSGYVYTQYTRGDELVALDFAPQYTMTRSERDQTQAQIDQRTEAVLAGIAAGATDYEKARYVFEYLASNVDYDAGAAENQNIISVFLYGKTVCQGYANATQYLLWEQGIRSAVVTGEANGEPHAWNLAQLDGEYYYIDTTWGNSAYAGSDIGMQRFINYSYFCVTSREIAESHRANDYIRLPEATATRNNYFIREGRYFSEWAPDAAGSVLKTAYDAGEVAVSLKFATQELYRQAKQYFTKEGHIADYCEGLHSLYYMEDEQQRVLTFHFNSGMTS